MKFYFDSNGDHRNELTWRIFIICFQEEPYLPDEILWRQKEQFSDGVGYSWIDQLMHYCAQQVTDEQVSQRGPF